jgi:hypothetical protein
MGYRGVYAIDQVIHNQPVKDKLVAIPAKVVTLKNISQPEIYDLLASYGDIKSILEEKTFRNLANLGGPEAHLSLGKFTKASFSDERTLNLSHHSDTVPPRRAGDGSGSRSDRRRHHTTSKEGCMGIRIGIDSGGTFTILIAIDDQTQRIQANKIALNAV